MIKGRWTILAAAVTLAACAPESAVEEGPRQLVATQVTAFGDAEGEGALSSVWSVAVSTDGHVYLSEPQFARVVAFNPDGTFDRVVGGRGDGPGEFRIPTLLTWRGDSLAVGDFQRGISLFGPDGAYVTSVSFTLTDGASAFGIRPIILLPDGSVAALSIAGNSDVTSGAVAHEFWLKTSRDGVIVDTLARVPLEGRLYEAEVNGRGGSGMHPMAWSDLVATPPDGSSLVFVRRPAAEASGAATYQVVRVGPDGDTLATAALSYEPVPLTDAHVDSITTEMAERWAAMAEATVPAAAAAIKAQLPWPAYQPPVTAVMAGSDGSVWLRREMAGTPAARWEVFDANLSPMGWVELPKALDVKVVARDGFYAVELDEMDVPRVVRYTVGAP